MWREKRGKNGGVRTTSNLAFNFLGRQSINVVSLELRKLTLLLLFRVLLLLSFSLPYPSAIDFFSSRVVRSSLLPLSLSPSLLPIRPLVIKSFVAGMSPETLSSSSPLHSQTGTCQTGGGRERERSEMSHSGVHKKRRKSFPFFSLLSLSLLIRTWKSQGGKEEFVEEKGEKICPQPSKKEELPEIERQRRGRSRRRKKEEKGGYLLSLFSSSSFLDDELIPRLAAAVGACLARDSPQFFFVILPQVRRRSGFLSFKKSRSRRGRRTRNCVFAETFTKGPEIAM